MNQPSVPIQKNLQPVASRIRGTVIGITHLADAMHLGSCLSCIDLLVYLYSEYLAVRPGEPDWDDRDRFILSKGHASLALYAVLADRGFFPEEELKTFNGKESLFTEHPVRGNVPGIEVSTGSLGHGPGLGLGIALAGKIMKKQFKSVVLMSDGECNEGTVWEAALLAPVHRLDNLIYIIDNNGWQATDRCDSIMELSPLSAKFSSFGWNAHDIDGHDFRAIDSVFRSITPGSGKPTAIIAHTIKGKGVSFMEDDNNWHYRTPTEEEVRLAREELGL
jgi:transketolase